MMPVPPTLRELFRMPEFFLGLAAVLIAVVGGTTLAYGDEGGAPSVVWATMMGLSVLFSIRRLRLPKIKEMFFLPTISFTSGLLLLVGSAMLFGRWGAEQWTAWTTLSSSILSFYATYLALYPRAPEFRRGAEGEGEKTRKGPVLVAAVAAIVFVGIVVYTLLPSPAAPETTIFVMKDAINARDVDKLYALFSDDLRAMTDENTLQTLLNTLDAAEFKIDEIEILEVTVENDTATVRMSHTITAKNPFTGAKETTTTETTVNLVLEEGAWKLAELVDVLST